mgnify:CR=1 FL=1
MAAGVLATRWGPPPLLRDPGCADRNLQTEEARAHSLWLPGVGARGSHWPVSPVSSLCLRLSLHLSYSLSLLLFHPLFLSVDCLCLSISHLGPCLSFSESVLVYPYFSPFLFKIILFIYLWLRWVFVTVQVFSSCSEPGATLVVVRRLLIAMASFVVEHWL